MADLGQDLDLDIDKATRDMSTLTFGSLATALSGGGEEAQADQDLVSIIETEILPRLMLVHKQHDAEEKDPAPYEVQNMSKTVNQLVQILLYGSADAARLYVSDLKQKGVSQTDLLLNVFTPAARQAGEMWTADTCSFTEVTISLCRLHDLLRREGLSSVSESHYAFKGKPSILLATACGDQHIFGLLMVAEFFWRDKWQVTCEPGTGIDELLRIVKTQFFHVIGLSAAWSMDPMEIASEIKRLRAASANPDVKIMIGGNLLTQDISIAERVGADAASTNAGDAPAAARVLLAAEAIGC